MPVLEPRWSKTGVFVLNVQQPSDCKVSNLQTFRTVPVEGASVLCCYNEGANRTPEGIGFQLTRAKTSAVSIVSDVHLINWADRY